MSCVVCGGSFEGNANSKVCSKGCAKIRDRVRRYPGLTVGALTSMYQGQGGRCAICRCERPLVEMNIDHCHDTKQIRGILCPNCNTGIGRFGDSAAMLRRAVAYLEWV